MEEAPRIPLVKGQLPRRGRGPEKAHILVEKGLIEPPVHEIVAVGHPQTRGRPGSHGPPTGRPHHRLPQGAETGGMKVPFQARHGQHDRHSSPVFQQGNRLGAEEDLGRPPGDRRVPHIVKKEGPRIEGCLHRGPRLHDIRVIPTEIDLLNPVIGGNQLVGHPVGQLREIPCLVRVVRDEDDLTQPVAGREMALIRHRLLHHHIGLGRVVDRHASDEHIGQGIIPAQRHIPVVRSRFPQEGVDHPQKGRNERGGIRALVVLEVVRAIPHEEDVNGRGALPMVVRVLQEVTDGLRGHDPSVEFIVHVLHIDQRDPIPLSGPICGQTGGRLPRIPVGDENVVRAVGRRTPLGGTVLVHANG